MRRLLWLLAACLPVAGAGQTYSNDADAAAVRKQLEALRRERAERSQAETFLPWERTDTPGPRRDLDNVGFVRIVNGMERLRGALVFERIEAEGTSQTIRLLLLPRAEEWIALMPGEWKVRLVAGEPGRSVARVLDEREIRIAARERREMKLDAARQEKWIARARERAAARRKSDLGSAGSSPQTPAGNSVTTQIRPAPE